LPLLKNNQKAALIAVAIAVPVLALTLYLNLGSPDSAHSSSALGQPRVASNDRSGNTGDVKIASVASMLDGLASRLEEDPDDAGSWLLLARSYKYLDRMNEAVDAYEHAVALGQFDAELDALGNKDAASSPAGAQISGNVTLAPEALDIVLPTDTVFIFAKAVNGPPAPIAVLQRAASELPIDFQLNDSQSMVAGMNLSSFDEVIVTARITRDGDATVALQGLEAKSDTIRVADSLHLNLTIR
jgi:tetratricopeptide (TPR) repeat protein